ncbi:hypothetical protein [Actinoplanes xinjiangensis]|uniref:hypothetical protein n=1 Tax=Actinoplanes xinjiangensis TaxID=512350 RepID=UPI0034481DF6
MPESPALAQVRRHAGTLADAGDLNGAQALLERAIEIGRAQLAQGDTELLSTMRQLAELHMRADDPMSARRVLEEAIEVGHRLDESDPLAVLLAYDLAVVAEELANRHVARSHYAKVAAFGPAALGEDHPAVTRARTYLGPEQPTAAAPAFETPVPVTTAEAPVPGPVPQMPAPTLIRESIVEPPSEPVAFASSAPATVRTSHRSRVFAAIAAGVAVIAVAAVLVRPGDESEPAAAVAGAVQAGPATVTLHDAGASVMVLWKQPNDGVARYTITGGPAGAAPQPLGVTGGDTSAYQVQGLDPARDYCFAVTAGYDGDGSATSPQACTSRTPPPSASTPSRAPSRTAGAAPATSRPTKAAPATTTAATTRTRIAAPANNSTVAWPFDARFTVSAADATASRTVLALSICVAGRCYLDGRVDLYDGAAAPYTVYLGSTKPEGSGVAWSLRLDRLTTSVYQTLIAERDAAIAAGTWGDTGIRMNALNRTPVSTLTVTKGS